jgi:hypothetical protein
MTRIEPRPHARHVRDEPRPQAAPAVLMVRPARFGWNPETNDSNRFQRSDQALAPVAVERAVAEFDALVLALRAALVTVYVAEDEPEPPRPDAVFPNNWVSLHPDGTVVLYPMLAPSRRRERRLDLVHRMQEQGSLRVSRLIDLTHYETRDLFLEGTGSVVFDHVARVAYAALSPRTHREPLDDLCRELGYEPCAFRAVDANGIPIYHTNVMLAIGTRFAVVAAHALEPDAEGAILARLQATGRDVLVIDADAMGRFAGNVLELRARDGASVLALSATAAAAVGPDALARLQRCVDRVVAVPIPTIETLGGGSVRCMLAEVFLPG